MYLKQNKMEITYTERLRILNLAPLTSRRNYLLASFIIKLFIIIDSDVIIRGKVVNPRYTTPSSSSTLEREHKNFVVRQQTPGLTVAQQHLGFSLILSGCECLRPTESVIIDIEI